MKPNSIKDSRQAWLEWFILWLAIGAGLKYYLEGENGAWAFLWSCWESAVIWAGVTIFIFGLILLAALLGGPFSRWFK